MDKQKQIEEMHQILLSAGYDWWKTYPNGKTKSEYESECFYNAGYRKIPEFAVMMTRERYEKLRSLADECLDWRRKNCNVGELPKENAVVLTREKFEELKNNQMPLHPIVLTAKQYTDLKLEAVYARKDTAEKFAEMLKERAFDEYAPSGKCFECVAVSDIDEICKKITEGVR